MTRGFAIMNRKKSVLCKWNRTIYIEDEIYSTLLGLLVAVTNNLILTYLTQSVSCVTINIRI